MNHFTNLRKADRRKLVEAGVVKRVAEATGKHKGTVSRTLAGHIQKPDPAVVEAIEIEMAAVLELKTA